VARFSKTLEAALRRAEAIAHEESHEFVTLEHLLLGLLEDEGVVQSLKMSLIDASNVYGDVRAFIKESFADIVVSTPDPRPTAGFQRALVRAMLRADSKDIDVIEPTDLLVSLSSEVQLHPSLVGKLGGLAMKLPSRLGGHDVFLSYSRSDFDTAQRIVRLLRNSGMDVWSDADIPAAAPWEAEIEKALATSELVLVCWSTSSVGSDNVRAEARYGQQHGKLIQLAISDVEPPLFFRESQCAIFEDSELGRIRFVDLIRNRLRRA
jgi:hypothetical protein